MKIMVKKVYGVTQLFSKLLNTKGITYKLRGKDGLYNLSIHPDHKEAQDNRTLGYLGVPFRKEDPLSTEHMRAIVDYFLKFCDGYESGHCEVSELTINAKNITVAMWIEKSEAIA